MNVPDIASLRELDQILQSYLRSLRTSSLGVAFECLHLSLVHPVYNIYQILRIGQERNRSPYPVEGTSTVKFMPIPIN